MPEPIDTIRRVNGDEQMTVPQLRRAAATLDRFTRTGKTDVLQARLRVNQLLERAGAPTVPAPSDLTRALARARDLQKRMDDGPPLTGEELAEGRANLEPHQQDGRNGPIEYTIARIDARLHALDTGEPLVDPEKPKTSKSATAAGVVVLLGAGALLASCVGYVVSNSSDDSSSDGGRDDGMATVMCEDFVEERLKAPSTADFSGVFDTTVTGTDDSYTVVGHVDAENSFGAMIRSNYTCNIRDNGDDSWTLHRHPAQPVAARRGQLRPSCAGQGSGGTPVPPGNPRSAGDRPRALQAASSPRPEWRGRTLAAG
jgi:hypothetical protein